MPKTKQNKCYAWSKLLVIVIYADDVVEKFIERAHTNGLCLSYFLIDELISDCNRR